MMTHFKVSNKVFKGIEIKTIVLGLFEAFYIRNYKPVLNSQEECSAFADLLS